VRGWPGCPASLPRRTRDLSSSRRELQLQAVVSERLARIRKDRAELRRRASGRCAVSSPQIFLVTQPSRSDVLLGDMLSANAGRLQVYERRSAWVSTAAAVIFLAVYAWPILEPDLSAGVKPAVELDVCIGPGGV
jgi:hypothetical protein